MPAQLDLSNYANARLLGLAIASEKYKILTPAIKQMAMVVQF